MAALIGSGALPAGSGADAALPTGPTGPTGRTEPTEPTDRPPEANVALAATWRAAPVHGIVELLDRDGHVRQSLAVHGWPLRIGRALDNDVVLSDPHVALRHLSLAPGAGPAGNADANVGVEVGDTRNGVQIGARRLGAGEHASVALHGDALELTAGRTRIRLRLPGRALAAELPLAFPAARPRRVAPVAAAALLLVAGLLFNTYLQNDPDALWRAAFSMLLLAAGVTAAWCSAWALLSKTFTRQAHFGWHLRVFLFSALALLAADAVPNLLAFMFSWPAVADFAFVGTFAVAATGFYFHLLAVEPARHRLMRWVAATGALAGIALTLWFNLQRTDRVGDDLYMSHLFPPALRIARPVPTDAFIDGMAALKPRLDKKAKDPDDAGDGGAADDDDE